MKNKKDPKRHLDQQPTVQQAVDKPKLMTVEEVKEQMHESDWEGFRVKKADQTVCLRVPTREEANDYNEDLKRGRDLEMSVIALGKRICLTHTPQQLDQLIELDWRVANALATCIVKLDRGACEAVKKS